MAELTIRTRRASAALSWVRAGLRLFGRRPVPITLLVAFGPLVVWTLGLVPAVGTAIALMLVPAMSIGMISVCRAAEQGALPSPENYVTALRDPFSRMQLLKIGVFHALVIGVLATAWSFVPDEPRLAEPALHAAPGAPAAQPAPAAPAAPAGTREPAPEAVEAAALTPARLALIAATAAVLIPLQMMLWFSPALVTWHRMAATKALFFSFFTCWRNRAAMIVYLCALLSISFLAVFIFAAFIGALGAGEQVARYLIAPLPLLLLAINQTCTLAMIRDILDEGTPAGGTGSGTPEPGANPPADPPQLS